MSDGTQFHFHAEERMSFLGEFSDWQDVAENAHVIGTESQAVQLAAAGLEMARCKFNAGVTRKEGFTPDRDLVHYTSDETAVEQAKDENIVYFAQFRRPDSDGDGGVEDFFQVRVQRCDGEVVSSRDIMFLGDIDDEDGGDFMALLSRLLGEVLEEQGGPETFVPSLPNVKPAA